ncbi:MAG: glycoside hydrolase family 16 protein [Actinomycetes bacterium]
MRASRVARLVVAGVCVTTVCIGGTMSASEASSPKFTKTKLLWSENFSGKAASAVPTIETYAEQMMDGPKTASGKTRTTYWAADQGDGSGSGGGAGWGNNEKEYYIDEMLSRDGQGNLAVTATRTDLHPDLAPLGWEDHIEWGYLSGKINTAGKLGFKYGYIEARIKTPAGNGTWPAFWLLGANVHHGVDWPQCGEIDIMENVGRDPMTVMGTIHGPGYSGGDGPTSNAYADAPVSDAFHKYAVLWLPNKIQWFFDGQLYQTLTPTSAGVNGEWVFNKEFFMIINVAMGGNLGGELDPSVESTTMLVDYVKYYKVKVGSKTYGTLYKH